MSAPIYKFSLDSFQILDTRARHNDTDYVTFSVQVGGGKPTTQTKFMGNLNNGVYPVDIVFDGIPVGSNQPVVMAYLITNSGHPSPSEATKAAESATETLVSAGAAAAVAALAAGEGEGIAAAVAAAIGALTGSAAGSVLGAAVGALAGYLIGKLISIINADCDGPVAVEVIPLVGRDMWLKTAATQIAGSTDQVLAGSPDGCHTSHYIVNWSYARTVRTTVAAARDGAGQTHLFAVGKDGRVYTAFTKPGTGWVGWGNVSSGVFHQGTAVATLSDITGRTHLFAIGEDGRVYTASAMPGEDWSAWAAVSSGVFQQGTVVAALYDSTGSRQRMRLFAVGEDGRVYTTSAEPAFGWGDWSAVPVGVFSQGTTVSALYDNFGKIRLFAVGMDGRVYTASAEPAQGAYAGPDNWSGWDSVSTGVFSLGTTVATHLDSTGAIHLFAVGEDGRVYSAVLNPGKAWDGWSHVANGVFQQGTTVATLADSAGRLHLFAVGEDGRVYTAVANSGQGWDGWANVSTGVFKQGTTVSTLDDGAGRMNLFAVGEDGRVYSAWAEPGKEWQGWANILDGVFS